VRLAIGSDNVRDSSAGEVEYLHSLGVFDNLTLLRLWTQTSKTIFPDRRVGELTEGFEATFLALEGDPIADFQNFRRIRMRFANGIQVPGGKD
jgi:imidazolonepropionase-like amidohydrolase